MRRPFVHPFATLAAVAICAAWAAAPAQGVSYGNAQTAEFSAIDQVDVYTADGQTGWASMRASRLDSGETSLFIRICTEIAVCTDYSDTLEPSEYWITSGWTSWITPSDVPGLGKVYLKLVAAGGFVQYNWGQSAFTGTTTELVARDLDSLAIGGIVQYRSYLGPWYTIYGGSTVTSKKMHVVWTDL